MKKEKDFNRNDIKDEKDLKKEQMENKDEEVKEIPTLNTLSIILYSFGLTFVELLTFDLIISDVNISQYKMNVTLGYIITFAIISAVTVIYMADRFENFRDEFLESKSNRIFMMIGIVSTIIIANVYLSKTLFSLSILTIIIIAAIIFIAGRIIEKKDKQKRTIK
ncbi:MAG: hypothetical protein Q4B23_02715 [Helcococcus sp.]|nr:hypothetical protein [Helcococcus sp.]